MASRGRLRVPARGWRRIGNGRDLREGGRRLVGLGRFGRRRRADESHFGVVRDFDHFGQHRNAGIARWCAHAFSAS
jgi:hypothetical protein